MSPAVLSKPSNALIGIAGVHYVVSELSLRGLIAVPTIRNTAGIDIIVNNANGNGLAALQFKTAYGLKRQEEGRQWWPMSNPAKCLKSPNAFYVFVRYRPDLHQFEAFLDTAADVVRQVDENLLDDQKAGRKDFPCWGLPGDPAEQERLASNWQTWKPDELTAGDMEAIRQ